MVSRDRVSVVSLESFVAQNLEELSEFRRAEFRSSFRQLLEIYNERVAEIDANQALQIEIPSNLT